jgi:hypothetical protein
MAGSEPVVMDGIILLPNLSQNFQDFLYILWNEGNNPVIYTLE